MKVIKEELVKRLMMGQELSRLGSKDDSYCSYNTGAFGSPFVVNELGKGIGAMGREWSEEIHWVNRDGSELDPLPFEPKAGDMVYAGGEGGDFRKRVFLFKYRDMFYCATNWEDLFLVGDGFIRSACFSLIKPIEEKPPAAKRPPTMQEVRKWMRDGYMFKTEGRYMCHITNANKTPSVRIYDEWLTLKDLAKMFNKVAIDGTESSCWIEEKENA